MNQVVQLLTPPVFIGDEERTRNSRLLYVMLWTYIVTATVAAICLVLAVPENALLHLIYAGVIDIFCFALMGLTRRGYTQLASITFVLFLWLVITTYTLITGGIHSPAMGGYILLVSITGFLMGGRTGTGAGVICGLTGLGMIYAETTGALPPSLVQQTPLSIWIVDIAVIAIIGSLQSSATRTIRDALQQAQQELTERKDAEAKLAASEAELRALFASMHDVVLVIDRDGVYREVAPTAPDLLYWPPAQLFGKTLLDVFSSDQADTFTGVIRQVLNTQQMTHIEYELLIQGVPLWFETTVSPMAEDKTLWVARNITERKRAEEALRHSEQRFRMVLDNLGEGVAVQDTDWRYTYANPAAHAIVSWSPGTLIGASEDDILSPASQVTGKHHNNLRINGQISSYETELIRPNGEIRTIIATGVPRLDENDQLIETFVTFTDITERKRADEELRRSEEKFRQLITSAPDAIIGANQSGKIIFVNREATKLLGYELEALISMNIEALIPARFRAAHTAKYSGYMANPHPRMRAGLELFATRKDGTEVPVEINLSRLDTEAGSLVTAFIRDVTVRKQAETALQHYTERLELLHEIDRSLLSAHSIHETARNALVRIRQLIPCPRASITLFEFDKREASFLSADLDPEVEIPNTPITFEEFGQRVIDELLKNEPWLSEDVLQDPQITELDKRLINEHGIRAWLCLPLLYQGQLIGSLNLGRPAGNPFTTEDAEIVREVADQLAIAIQQNRLLETTQRQLLELSVLHSVALAGVNASSEEALLESVIEVIGDILYPDNFSILLLDESAQGLRAGARRGVPEEVLSAVIPLTLGIVSAVARSGQPRRVPDVRQDPDYYALIPGIQSELCVPIKGGDHVLGVINIEGKKLNAFSETDERLLMTVAGQLASALDHLRAEAALLESNERFRQMADNIQEVFWIGDPVSNENIYTSPAYEKIWGFDHSTATKLKEFYKIVLPQDLPLLQTAIEKQAGGEQTEAEYRIHHPDGSVRWIWERGFPILDENGKTTRVVGVATDITERKKAEESLREAEVKYRTLVENIPPIVYVAARDQHIGVTYVSPQIESIGFNQDEWVANPNLWFRQIHPDDQARILDEIEQIKQSGRPFKSTYRIKSREGTVKWFLDEAMDVVNSDGALLFRQGFMLDITETKQAEEREMQRRAALEKVVRLGKLVTEAADLRTTLTRIWHGVHDELGFDRVAIFLYDRPSHSIKGTLGTGANGEIVEEWDYSQSLHRGTSSSFTRALEQPGGVFFTDNFGEEFNIPEGHEMHNVKEFAAVTAWGGEKPVAIICVDNLLSKRSITQEPLEALRLFAGYAGLAIENSRLNIELENRVIDRTAQLNEANQNLHQEKVRLEQYSRQRELMGTMTDLLQASLTTEEASGIVSRYMQLLFPNRDGALYMLNTSAMLEPVAIWGEEKSLDTMFAMNECWALRRGKTYRFGSGSPNPPCAHVGAEITQSALCIPITAQGESIGSLHIATESIGEGGLIDNEEQRFIETITDSVALALANVRLRERLRTQSIRDGLTGLFNRRYLDETLPREIHRAERSKSPISVLMFDIDSFKKFNDTYGHDAGDVVLKRIAETVLANIRPSDIACRYGGEEFTIVLPDTALEVAHARGEALREAAAKMSLQHNGKDLGNVTISLGVASYPQHGMMRDTLIKSADEASYKAKQAGKNRVVLADSKQTG